MRKLADVTSARGAPMGRISHPGADYRAPLKFSVQRVRINRGGYDDGGAYWGIGAPLYWAASDDGAVDLYFRAADREAAKAHLRATYPHAKFHR